MEERKKSPKCFAIQSSERKSGIAFAFSTWRKKVFYYNVSASELDCTLSINTHPLIFHNIYR